MENWSALEKGIWEIGDLMVHCGNGCSGVSLTFEEGILPRCLFFETQDRIGGVGSVIVGFNPGRSGSAERRYYQDRKSYDSTLEYWKQRHTRWPYYTRLRRLVDGMGFGGPILWTELVKCESDGSTLPPLQTFRVCTSTYLWKELEVVPPDWPLVAVGREAYKALAYLYPTRAIIGVPHPTGGCGLFHRLFEGHQLLPAFRLPLSSLWDGQMEKLSGLPERGL